MSRAYPGDEIFFHKSGQPCCGKVLSAGKHGCFVEHDGQRHKLKWAHLAGHKKRTQQNYTVVDKGEDGIVVQDANGRRRLVSIPPEARQERLAVDK